MRKFPRATGRRRGVLRPLGFDMGWRQGLVRSFSPGLMSGVSFGDWVRLLWDNGFRVSPRCWPKAVVTTLLSLAETPLHWLESALYGRRVAAQKVLPPLFVLGHWRSGTTHLHRLLAADPRFAYPTFSQVWHPHDFLLTDRLRAKAFPFLMPATRGQDNVALHPEAPEEDEFALCRTSLLSVFLGQAFPDRAEHYDRYLTFRGVPAKEVERWKAAFLRLAKKWTWMYGRPLLFKSPPHTARLKLLLEVFPDARFVHVHRNPYVVYQSTRRMLSVAYGVFAFQQPDLEKLHGRVLRDYAVLYEAYFEERGLVPAGRLCEVGFEDLEKDPIGQMRRVYAELGLPDFEAARPALESYVASLAGYKKTEHPHLPPEVRADIVRAWRRCFEEWGYPL
jgi:LPS sulfotransferase NodH